MRHPDTEHQPVAGLLVQGERVAWLRSHGEVDAVRVEDTGTYSAGLARYLHRQGVGAVEVERPNRKTRRVRDKFDRIDAEAAARAVLAGTPNVDRLAGCR